MTTQFTTKRASEILFIVLIAVCCGAILHRCMHKSRKQ